MVPCASYPSWSQLLVRLHSVKMVMLLRKKGTSIRGTSFNILIRYLQLVPCSHGCGHFLYLAIHSPHLLRNQVVPLTFWCHSKSAHYSAWCQRSPYAFQACLKYPCCCPSPHHELIRILNTCSSPMHVDIVVHMSLGTSNRWNHN